MCTGPCNFLADMQSSNIKELLDNQTDKYRHLLYVYTRIP